MHIHIMGVAGTFMAGLARLAKNMGYTVTGSEQAKVYPPMSTQLEEDGIALMAPYAASNLNPRPDHVIVGNAIKRGNPEIEAVLNLQLPYSSGPEWLAKHILQGRHVMAVAGTHGKTTTSTLLAWILHENAIDAGYLIGGVPRQLPGSAYLGTAPYFVIEADEYDSAFFDKRSKFIHYRPRTAIINNIEFDHADIFENVAAIQKQFHHLVRIIPSEGLIVHPLQDRYVDEVLAMGAWTPCETFGLNGAGIRAELIKRDGSEFDVFDHDKCVGRVTWSLTGEHNVMNALAAIAAAKAANVEPTCAIEPLCRFLAPKRRMEMIVDNKGVRVYDDFAHHPTAIEKTLHGLRMKVGDSKIIVLLEMRSYSMRSNVHGDAVIKSLAEADEVYVLKPRESAEAVEQLVKGQSNWHCFDDISPMKKAMMMTLKSGEHVLIMSNGSFDGLREQLVEDLS
ncbi:MAG: UDP-N-acetylmuramate:L-alanyl-gamma-D-glutamyl-meso-diaminopimelate ligase [Gammaproteobacteria bacterium]